MIFPKTALSSEATKAEFCPEETARNITWMKIYHGQTVKQLCPNGTVGNVLEDVASTKICVIVVVLFISA